MSAAAKPRIAPQFHYFPFHQMNVWLHSHSTNTFLLIPFQLLKIKEIKIKESESNWLDCLAWLVSFLCGALAAAAAHNPPKKNKPNPTNQPSAQANAIPIHCWALLSAHNEWICFVCFLGLPRCCGQLGAAFVVFRSIALLSLPSFH